MNRSLTTTSLRSHTAVASGYLHKLAHNGTPFAGWHQRYYVLYSDGVLRSYKSSRSRNSHRIIHVGRKCLRVRFGSDTRNDECCRWPKGGPRSRCFSIINSDREYHFYCDSEREFASWRESLQHTLVKLGSAHSSYVERRGSKMNRIADWLNSGSDEESQNSSTAATPASRKKGRPWIEGKGSQKWDKWEKYGYDAMGTALPTDPDEMAVSECEEESEEREPHRETPRMLKKTVLDTCSHDLEEMGSLSELTCRATIEKECVETSTRHKNRQTLQQVSLNGRMCVSMPAYSAGNITSAVGGRNKFNCS